MGLRCCSSLSLTVVVKVGLAMVVVLQGGCGAIGHQIMVAPRADVVVVAAAMVALMVALTLSVAGVVHTDRLSISVSASAHHQCCPSPLLSVSISVVKLLCHCPSPLLPIAVVLLMVVVEVGLVIGLLCCPSPLLSVSVANSGGESGSCDGGYVTRRLQRHRTTENGGA